MSITPFAYGDQPVRVVTIGVNIGVAPLAIITRSAIYRINRTIAIGVTIGTFYIRFCCTVKR